MTALNPTRLQRAEHYFTLYGVALQGSDTLEDALKPEYWAHVASKLRRGDMIRLMPEDDSFYAEALVLATGIGFAKVELIHHLQLDESEIIEDEDGPVYVKWGGPHAKWRIIRRSDGHVLKEGIPDKAAALRESLNFARLAA